MESIEEDLAKFEVVQDARIKQIRRIENDIRPLESGHFGPIQEEAALYARRIGRLEEELSQLERLRTAAALEKEIEAEQNELEVEIEKARKNVDQILSEIDIGSIEDAIAQGMNHYFHEINEIQPDIWTQGPVEVTLSPKELALRIRGAKWSGQLGGTLRAILLLAYHHSLLLSTGKSGIYFPGFCMLDFPPTFLEADEITDKENFLLEPFLRVCQSDPGVQVIIAGRAFEGMKCSKRFELNEVFESGGTSLPEGEVND